MLTRSGNVLKIPYQDAKVLCFVQDFDEELPDLNNRTFASRPKSAGLWVRLLFRDGALMDGLLANNLLALESHGYTLTPPDRSITPQRIFVPKAALQSLHVLAVVGGGLTKGKKSDDRQISIFE